MPAAGVYPVSVAEVNDALVEWGHKLGPCNRPFRSDGWALEVSGRRVAVAMSSSIVSATVDRYTRQEVVELSRLCACEPWANRVLLRLWREVCAHSWCWPVKAAISYSLNAQHTGNLYRFDGWERVKQNCGSSGGGQWSTKREPGTLVAGSKSLWVWRYDS